MVVKMFAPAIDNIISRYRQSRELSDRLLSPKLEVLYEKIRFIKPDTEIHTRQIWIEVSRGDIKDFGDFNEFLDNGEVETIEEFENLWKELYPEEKKWYNLTVLKDNEDIYLSINSELSFTTRKDEHAAGGQDHVGPDLISCIDGLLLLVKEVIENLVTSIDSYNDYIEKNLSYHKRFGRIRRKDFWEIFGDDIIRPDKELDAELIGKLSEINARQKETGYNPLIQEMTADDFFRYCEICYEANPYFSDSGSDLSPREKYSKMADGRDAGLRKIDGGSPQAFSNWFQSSERLGVHPWEISRGGNSTHISLHVSKQNHLWKLTLAGSSIGRVSETVRMAVALFNKNIPFILRDSEEIEKMVTGNDYIGIVPDNIIPRYCHGYFPSEEKIIDFMNLGHDNADDIKRKAYWYTLKRLEIIR